MVAEAPSPPLNLNEVGSEKGGIDGEGGGTCAASSKEPHQSHPNGPGSQSGAGTLGSPDSEWPWVPSPNPPPLPKEGDISNRLSICYTNVGKSHARAACV